MMKIAVLVCMIALVAFKTVLPGDLIYRDNDASQLNEYTIEDENISLIDFEKRNKVKEMMLHAWNNYKKYAWGKNELAPITRGSFNDGVFGAFDLGATIIDSLDTLYVMGLMEEFQESRQWIETKFTFENITAPISVFETNIRYVGGLLAAYALTKDDLFKDKAQYVANKLLPAFNTSTGIPRTYVNFETGIGSGKYAILSEFGTLSLEFIYLSEITGNPIYKEAIQKIQKVLRRLKKRQGLYPNYLNPKSGRWGRKITSVGAFGDSFYEYLLKSWIQTGKQDERAHDIAEEALVSIGQHLIRTSKKGSMYISSMINDKLDHTMEHLTCFAGGMYGMASRYLNLRNTNKFMKVAKGITRTCHESYNRSTTGLGPEVFKFGKEKVAAINSIYILRPETVESYFIMWRLTHEQKYRDWGWEVVQALELNCRTKYGYSGIKSVYADPVEHDNIQQSFFLAETLKYLYLLYSDDSLLSLDDWVFNTEAHPLPILSPK
ncbi:unnamed protein product [Diamesa hyperborea]